MSKAKTSLMIPEVQVASLSIDPSVEVETIARMMAEAYRANARILWAGV